MPRLTKQKKQEIVRRFAHGASLLDLYHIYRIPIAKFEAIIRDALQKQGRTP
jgi:hypothetical protein